MICEDMHKKLYNWTVYITEQYMKIFNYWISLNINTLKNQSQITNDINKIEDPYINLSHLALDQHIKEL